MGDETKTNAILKIEIAGVSDLLDAVAKDGALALLIGKPASQAISRVIAGAASIPEAWFKARAQDIADGQAARSRVNDAVAGSLETLAPKDQALVDRAAIRWLGQAVREQDNLEAVAAQATADLQADPSTATESPSDDFLNRFTDAAGKASSGEMRDLFARVLAGEVRRPGTFSLAALHVFSVMDAPLAKTIQKYASVQIAGTFFLANGGAARGLRLQEMRTLESFGLLSTGLSLPLPAKDGKITLLVPGYILIVGVDSLELKEIDISAAATTSLGREIFGLVAAEPSKETLELLADDIMDLGRIMSVSVLPIDSQKRPTGSLQQIRPLATTSES